MERGESEVGTDEQGLLSGAGQGFREADRGGGLAFLLERAGDEDDLSALAMRVRDRRLERLIRLLCNQLRCRLASEATVGQRHPGEHRQPHQLGELAWVGNPRPQEVPADHDQDEQEHGGEKGDDAVTDRSRREGARGRGRRLGEPQIVSDARLRDDEFADPVANGLELLHRRARRANASELDEKLRTRTLEAARLRLRVGLDQAILRLRLRSTPPTCESLSSARDVDDVGVRIDRRRDRALERPAGLAREMRESAVEDRAGLQEPLNGRQLTRGRVDVRGIREQRRALDDRRRRAVLLLRERRQPRLPPQ